MSVQSGAAPFNNFGPEREGHEPQVGPDQAAEVVNPLSTLRLPAMNTPPLRQIPLHATFGPSMILDVSDHRREIVEAAPTTVLSKDAGSFGKLIELHDEIDQTVTRLGSAALLRDILVPPSTIEQVSSRRAAIEELRTNNQLREALEEALERARDLDYHGFDREELALRFFVPDKADRWAETASIVERSKECVLEWLNLDRKITAELRAIGALLDQFTPIDGATSPLMRELLGAIRVVRSSPDSPLLDGAVRRSITGVHPPGALPWYIPRFYMSGGLLNVEVPLYGLATFLASEAITKGTLVSAAYSTAANNAVCSAFGAYLIARAFLAGDRMQPKLRSRVGGVEGLFGALDAVGELDALLSLSKLPEKFGDKGSWPSFIEGESYALTAREMHHPVLVEAGGSVGNVIHLRGGRANVLTGPNSGGKTTIVTGILQNQILAQLGTVVAARNMTVTVADQILFQGPSFAALGDHGRFGTELAATKAIFDRATPRSLVILDEVGDGTTAEERTETGYRIIWGFNEVGAGTCLVTHNVNLARRLADENMAESFQMEFTDGAPTYRVIGGISTVSHAESVARSIGFSRDDIERMVRQKTGDTPRSVGPD